MAGVGAALGETAVGGLTGGGPAGGMLEPVGGWGSVGAGGVTLSESGTYGNSQTSTTLVSDGTGTRAYFEIVGI